MRSSRPSRPADAPPSRAKRLSQSGARDPRLSVTSWRELDRYEDAANAFGLACDERSGLGRIDECYGELVFHATGVIRALLEDLARGRSAAQWQSAALSAELEAHVSGTHAAGDVPERDIKLAELALAEARALPRREEGRDEASTEATESDRRAV